MALVKDNVVWQKRSNAGCAQSTSTKRDGL